MNFSSGSGREDGAGGSVWREFISLGMSHLALNHAWTEQHAHVCLPLASAGLAAA